MDKFYLIALHSLPQMSDRNLMALLEHYELDAEACWNDSAHWHLLPLYEAERLAENCRAADAEAIYESFLNTDASCISVFDADYPELLREIYDAPTLLFYKGVLPAPDEICVAMIGSRSATAYGRLTGEKLAFEVASQGISVVSGLARGIDTACHKAAIKSGGKTYAVLGCGIDVIYPRENERLYAEIAEHGAILSEFPCGAPPLSAHFPRRNRIISGLSRGVVVIEAGEKSGTLRTVANAIAQNRDVFAVPGPITSIQSMGTNMLLKQGAKLVTCGEDIWSAYVQAKAQPVLNAARREVTEDEKRLLDLLVMPMQFDALVQETALAPAALSAQLTMLELDGLIEQLPGKFYIAL